MRRSIKRCPTEPVHPSTPVALSDGMYRQFLGTLTTLFPGEAGVLFSVHGDAGLVNAEFDLSS